MSETSQFHKAAGEHFAVSRIVECADRGLSKPRIVCAANRIVYVNEQGQIERALIAGARHCDSVMRRERARILKLVDEGQCKFISEEQGFIDQHGAYYDRFAARYIANEQNQITRTFDSDETMGLCSENLY